MNISCRNPSKGAVFQNLNESVKIISKYLFELYNDLAVNITCLLVKSAFDIGQSKKVDKVLNKAQNALSYGSENMKPVWLWPALSQDH